MYTIGVRGHFDAAHLLRGYEGKCAQLHGHRWEVEAVCCAETLDGTGMALDFSVLRRALAEVLETFDHRQLNDIPPFDTLNPTAENLARVVFERLAGLPGPALREVKVWESPDCWASFGAAAPLP